MFYFKGTIQDNDCSAIIYRKMRKDPSLQWFYKMFYKDKKPKKLRKHSLNIARMPNILQTKFEHNIAIII